MSGSIGGWNVTDKLSNSQVLKEDTSMEVVSWLMKYCLERHRFVVSFRKQEVKQNFYWAASFVGPLLNDVASSTLRNSNKLKTVRTAGCWTKNQTLRQDSALLGQDSNSLRTVGNWDKN
jgi:hypothetical protein